MSSPALQSAEWVVPESDEKIANVAGARYAVGSSALEALAHLAPNPRPQTEFTSQ